MGYISATKMRADVAAAIAAGSDASLLFANQTIPVWLSPVSRSDDVDEIGALQESDIEAVGDLGDFDPVPEVRDVIQIKESSDDNAVRYHVERITRDQSAVHLFLRRA
jgi:hypothetical protein